MSSTLRQLAWIVIGQAYCGAGSASAATAVGRDIRESSGKLQSALARGLTDSGVDVADIGLCGTEGVYFATFSPQKSWTAGSW